MSKQLSSCNNSCRGFTLLELLIALAIMAILVAAAVPTATSISNTSHLKGAAEALMSNMLLARSEAIRNNNEVRISFQAGSNWCFGMKDGGASCNCNTANSCTITSNGVTKEKVVSYQDYDGVSLSVSGFSDLTYELPQATVNSNGTGTATFSIDGDSLGVQINTLLGRPKFCSSTFSKYPTC